MRFVSAQTAAKKELELKIAPVIWAIALCMLGSHSEGAPARLLGIHSEGAPVLAAQHHIAKHMARKQPAPPAHKPAAATVNCPACHMDMPQKYSDATPISILVHGKRFYCCPNCAMGIRAVNYMRSNKKVFSADDDFKAAMPARAK